MSQGPLLGALRPQREIRLAGLPSNVRNKEYDLTNESAQWWALYYGGIKTLTMTKDALSPTRPTAKQANLRHHVSSKTRTDTNGPHRNIAVETTKHWPSEKNRLFYCLAVDPFLPSNPPEPTKALDSTWDSRLVQKLHS